jgi:uncharacterized peroxidase-related enzyme
MQRIQKIDAAAAPQKTKDLLQAVKAQMGVVPALLQTMAHAPAALAGYLGLASALGDGALHSALREQIAVAVAGANGCDYCASAHTMLGEKRGLSKDELARNLAGSATDPQADAALSFVGKIVSTRGRLADADLAAIRDAGFTEEEIVEIIAHTSMNIFTNYFNHIAATEVDFPRVRAAA